jgi:hypothetical protein
MIRPPVPPKRLLLKARKRVTADLYSKAATYTEVKVEE